MQRKLPASALTPPPRRSWHRDLSGLDFSQFRATRFEFEKKTAQPNMRLPVSLLDAVKQRAAARGIPSTGFIREAVEHALAEPRKVR